MRTILLAASFTLFATAAAAQAPAPATPTPDAVAQVYRCAETTDDAQRLACYDAAVGRLRTAQQTGEVTVIDRASVAEVERDSFGFSLPSLSRLLPFGGRDAPQTSAQQSSGAAPQEIRPDEQEFSVQRVIDNGSGRNTFVMTNGQVWTQIEARRSRVRNGDAVTIRRAVLGSFVLVPQRGGEALRVHRQE